ncbi:MAG: hypothetical protein ACI9SC_002828, partial [Gammaproteobacteria bacterium]
MRFFNGITEFKLSGIFTSSEKILTTYEDLSRGRKSRFQVETQTPFS